MNTWDEARTLMLNEKDDLVVCKMWLTLITSVTVDRQFRKWYHSIKEFPQLLVKCLGNCLRSGEMFLNDSGFSFTR
jgi:hypothetical protein